MIRKLAFFTFAAALLFTAALLAGAPSDAQAQSLETGGLDLNLFRAPVDSKGHVTVNGSDIIGHNDYSFGLILDAGIGLLPYYGFAESTSTTGANAGRERRLVDTIISGTFMLNWGIKNWVVVGAQLPVRMARGGAVQGLMNDGTAFYNGTPAGAAASGLSQEGLGDIQLHAKVRLLRVERKPIGLAAIVRLGIPTGSSDHFTGEPGASLWPSLVGEVRPHRKLRISLEAGYRAIFGGGANVNIGARTCPGTSMLMGTTCMDPGPGTNAINPQIAEDGVQVRYGDLLTFGLGMSARVSRHLDLIVEGYGTQLVKHFQPEGLSVEGLLGLKAFVHENSYLIIAGGAGVPRHGIQNADYRVTLGFVFEPSIGDADGDGIKDDEDKCPNDPEDFDGFEDEDGCPDPDNDGDGIPDIHDECPNIPEDFDGFEDEDGCPESNGTGTGDRDGDGIPDHLDACPDDPEDFDGFEDEDGCPEPDNDGDGILDIHDLCPNEPENFNGMEDEDGCPDEGSVIIEDDQLVVLDKIYFETNSASIQSRSFPIIEAIAATLKGNPQIALMEVQGHADERGNDEHNLELTRERAAAVVEALVQRGVQRNRVRSAGYGELCPIDTRSNKAAWEKNRRVEFKIVRTSDGPTGIELTCPAARHLVPSRSQKN